MKKRYAILLCMLGLLFSLGMGTLGYLLIGDGFAGHPVLSFGFRFCFTCTPIMLVLAIITIVRMEKQ